MLFQVTIYIFSKFHTIRSAVTVMSDKHTRSLTNFHIYISNESTIITNFIQIRTVIMELSGNKLTHLGTYLMKKCSVKYVYLCRFHKKKILAWDHLLFDPKANNYL